MSNLTSGGRHMGPQSPPLVEHKHVDKVELMKLFVFVLKLLQFKY